MFDHLALHVTDMTPFVPLLEVLGVEPSHADDELTEWEDFDLDSQTPRTRNLHVGLVAPDVATIEAFWRRGLELGFTDDGEPGPRPEYGGDYVGGFLRDQDGNSIEACLHGGSGPPGLVDHVWLRVRDLAASRAFYTGLAEYTGFEPRVSEEGFENFRGQSASFHLVEDPAAPTAHVHIAFGTDDDAVVQRFHTAALALGARDNGGPGERPRYHPGYYGAFVLDPDGNNIEVVNHHR